MAISLWGDTVEEHDKAVAAKANAMRVKQEDFFNKKLEERKIELNAIRKGWYHVELEIRINVLNKIGNDYVADKTFSGDIIAESGMDAYNKAVEYVKKSPSELCTITTTGILQDYSNPYDNGFSFIFLGVRTDDGYSVEKWEELMEK